MTHLLVLSEVDGDEVEVDEDGDKPFLIVLQYGGNVDLVKHMLETSKSYVKNRSVTNSNKSKKKEYYEAFPT